MARLPGLATFTTGSLDSDESKSYEINLISSLLQITHTYSSYMYYSKFSTKILSYKNIFILKHTFLLSTPSDSFTSTDNLCYGLISTAITLST